MMDEFVKLLKSKAEEQKGKPKKASEMKAKASMAKELSSMLGDSMLDDMKGGMKKVTVASNNEEGLKKGLEKAEDILEKKSMEESESLEEESPEEMLGEEEEDKEPKHMMHRERMGMKDDSEEESMSDLKKEIEMLKQELENLKKR
jgi:hypothetical protein